VGCVHQAFQVGFIPALLQTADYAEIVKIVG
jgi:hypothetical protein